VISFAFTAWWLPAPAPVPLSATAARVLSLAEVARHASPDDCWMAIDSQVYDLSSYLPDHPADPAVILAWCGREASEAYRTKQKGRPHSVRADHLLDTYRIGALEAPRR